VAPLPPARTPGHYRVELVCLGNICRSPTAHVVLADRVAAAGLADRVTVTSSGTGPWHVGEPMDRRAAATLTAAGYDPSRHRGRQWDGHDTADLHLAMDASNLAGIGGPGERARLFRDHDPDPSAAEGDADVPDPYYGGPDGFEEVLEMVERTATALVDALLRERPWETPQP
jgi:protein-tyrosine phosphatase